MSAHGTAAVAAYLKLKTEPKPGSIFPYDEDDKSEASELSFRD